MNLDGRDCSKIDKNGNIYSAKKAPPRNLDDFVNELILKSKSKHLKISYSNIIILFAIILAASLIYSFGDYIFPPNDFNEKLMRSSTVTVPVKASGEPVILINNESAANPTWDELISFLKVDDTDRILYQNNTFVSSDFAERLHNNAEKAGIRASFVVVDFYDSTDVHAINAFETTDKGLTYVDCTGSIVKLQELDSFDKIAYIQKGKKYGIVSIYYTDTPEYEYYNIRKDYLFRRGFYDNLGYVYTVNVYWEHI
ncbi:MAG: hypothetical protein Q8J68_00270 [Methanolobus sp.]|uniref:hypothetical protein n=1 Tax=Methanolobus sp. TaxID=1874737 RepID=UPI00272F199A|nr:hypothetical protein [Methanolobus sp.]MDP2215716.1 hypothetical protein [Methanolobus sp.]